MGKIKVEFEESDWVPIEVTVIKEDSNKEEGCFEDLRKGIGIYFNPELYISNMMEEKDEV